MFPQYCTFVQMQWNSVQIWRLGGMPHCYYHVTLLLVAFLMVSDWSPMVSHHICIQPAEVSFHLRTCADGSCVTVVQIPVPVSHFRLPVFDAWLWYLTPAFWKCTAWEKPSDSSSFWILATYLGKRLSFRLLACALFCAFKASTNKWHFCLSFCLLRK